MFLHNFQTCFMNICYKTTTFLPSEGAISDCFQPFPLGHLWTFKKKTALRGNVFLKKCGLDKFWPDHVSDCFRLFPTVSDRFIFSERLIGPIPFMEGWSSANPCKPWRLSFFVRPLCAYTAPNIASWPWYPIFPKNPRSSWNLILYIYLIYRIYLFYFVYLVYLFYLIYIFLS